MSELPDVTARTPTPPGRDEADYRQGRLDLLGLIAYGGLCAFRRLAADAAGASTLADRVELSGVAADQYVHFDWVRARLRELDADPMAAMAPFESACEAYQARTAPRTFVEGLVKSYVGQGLAGDLYAEIAPFVDADTRQLLRAVLLDEALLHRLGARIAADLAADPDAVGRSSLYARRMVGEALSQAQRLVTDRDALCGLIARASGPGAGHDLAAVTRMFTRIIDRHSARMTALGLTV